MSVSVKHAVFSFGKIRTEQAHAARLLGESELLDVVALE
jgi:hypothetical protein